MNKNLKIAAAVGVAIIIVVGLWLAQSTKPKADGQKVLRVAVLAPLTGAAASAGDNSKKGFEMALDELRKQGASISVEYHDTQSNPKTAVSIYQQLMGTSQPDVIISELSGVTESLKPMLTGKCLTIATVVADPKLSAPGENSKLYRVFLGADGLGKTAAECFMQAGAKKAVAIYVNDDYGKACVTALKQHYLAAGSNSLKEEAFGLLDKDFRNSWAKILSDKPDALFICGYGPGYLTVLNQLRETDYKGLIVVDWSLTDPSYMKATGGVRNGTKVITVEWTPEFESEFKTRYGSAGSFVVAGYCHATLKLLWTAYSASDKSVNGMTKKFSELKDVNTVMGEIDLLPSGGVSAPCRVFSVNDMALVKDPQ